jgi:uncharacterized repeat protein (TIGR01451 family)
MFRRTRSLLAVLLAPILLVSFLTMVSAAPAEGAVTPGTVVGWGLNNDGQSSVPGGLTDAVAVAAGGYHSLAVRSDGTVVAWGSNSYGQTTVPPGLGTVTQVAGGAFHSLALKADGTVVAWGHNGYGQATVPAGLSGVTAISAGNYHSLALKGDGTVVAWGMNYFGQGSVPAGLHDVVAIASGSSHNLALKSDGTVVAWGYPTYGGGPVPAGLDDVVAIGTGWYHNLAIRADGTVVSWGYDVYGSTVVPAGLTGVVAVTGGEAHSLALKADGTVVAWGWNGYQQATVPVGLTGVRAISAGVAHSLALVGPSDSTPPVLTVPADVTVPATDGTGAVVDFTVTATDDTDPSPQVVCTPSSGATYPLGTTTVTCTATDDAGNVATDTFTVTVVATARLSLEKSVSPLVAEPGGHLTFTLVVRNAGPSPARDVELTDRVPDGLSIAGLSGGVCVTEGQLVACHLGTVLPGASRTVTITAIVDPVLANTRHQHELGFAKEETHLTLDAGETDTATALCPTGYLATDGSVRIDSVDQGTGSFDDVVVLASGATAAGDGWSGRAHNTATGRAQVKVNVVCVSAATVSGEGHTHRLQVSALDTADLAFTDGGTQEVDRTCAAGSLAISPGFTFGDGQGVVSERRTGTGWHFTVTSDGPAHASVSIRCLSTTTATASGHAHELAATQLQGAAVVPPGVVVERSLTCPVGAKGIVAWVDMEAGLVSMGNDPQPITRVFRFYNYNPTGSDLGVDYGLTCLGVRSWTGVTTNTATVTTSTYDASGAADDSDSVTFTLAAGGVSIGPAAQVSSAAGTTRVRVHLTSTRARTVTVKLVATAPVPGTDLVAGDVLARRTGVRLVAGRQASVLDTVGPAGSALRHGAVDQARLVVVGADGSRTVRLVSVD